MGWIDILKRVDIRNEREYEAASLEDRRKWHNSQYTAYSKRWQTMRNTQVENEDSPMYKEMVELQDLANFHSSQAKRITSTSPKERRRYTQDYFSSDLQGEDRQKQKNRNSPQGNPIPYTILTQEVYETLSDDKKRKYHLSIAERGNFTKEEKTFHLRMWNRLHQGKSNLPTFASLEHGGESLYGRNTSKEEYENMTDEMKIKYHNRMYQRFLRPEGDRDKAKWHGKMSARLKNKSKRPTFYSQEEEGEQ